MMMRAKRHAVVTMSLWLIIRGRLLDAREKEL